MGRTVGKVEGAYEESRICCCTAPDGVAGGSAGHYVERSGSEYGERPTTVRWSSRPVSSIPSPNDRRYLRRANGSDVLQRTLQPEHGWLRIRRRDRVERRIRRSRQQHIVYPAMRIFRPPTNCATDRRGGEMERPEIALRRNRSAAWGRASQVHAYPTSRHHSYWCDTRLEPKWTALRRRDRAYLK